MAVDVATDVGPGEQLEVVGTGECADVVDLWDAWCEELDDARRQVLVVVCDGVVEGGVDLVEVEVGGGVAGREAGYAAGTFMDSLDQGVDLIGGEQTGRGVSPGWTVWSGPTSMTPMPSWVSSTVTALVGRMLSQRTRGSPSPV